MSYQQLELFIENFLDEPESAKCQEELLKFLKANPEWFWTDLTPFDSEDASVMEKLLRVGPRHQEILKKLTVEAEAILGSYAGGVKLQQYFDAFDRENPKTGLTTSETAYMKMMWEYAEVIDSFRDYGEYRRHLECAIIGYVKTFPHGTWRPETYKLTQLFLRLLPRSLANRSELIELIVDNYDAISPMVLNHYLRDRDLVEILWHYTKFDTCPENLNSLVKNYIASWWKHVNDLPPLRHNLCVEDALVPGSCTEINVRRLMNMKDYDYRRDEQMFSIDALSDEEIKLKYLLEDEKLSLEEMAKFLRRDKPTLCHLVFSDILLPHSETLQNKKL